MKKLSAVIFALSVIASVFSGCGGETYAIYTNLSREEFSVQAGNFVVCEGLNASGSANGDNARVSAGFSSRTHVFYAMGAEALLVISADFSDEATLNGFNALCTEIEEVLYSLDNSLSATIPTSDVSVFNAAGAGDKVLIGYHTYNLLNLASDIYEKTEGYYNPAVYHSVKAYGFLGGERPEDISDLPSSSLSSKLADLANMFGEVELSSKDGEYYALKPDFTVTHDDTEYTLNLDLGGIGKGYAVDVVNGLLDDYGFEYGYFSFASSSIAVKRNSSVGEYTIGLRNPRGSGDYLCVKTKNTLISTSGDYFLYYTLAGERYCSVIDPHTGKPVRSGVITATVFGGSAAENDAYTTAIMAMGKDRALQFVNAELTDRKFVFVCEKEG